MSKRPFEEEIKALFGVDEVPPLFESTFSEPHYARSNPPISKLSLYDIRKSGFKSKLTTAFQYVVLDDGELILSRRYSNLMPFENLESMQHYKEYCAHIKSNKPSLLIPYSHSNKEYISFFVDNHRGGERIVMNPKTLRLEGKFMAVRQSDLASNMRVAAAGEFYIKDGKIVKFCQNLKRELGINSAGNDYFARGEHLPQLVEHVFQKNGFDEAKGMFKHSHDDLGRLPNNRIDYQKGRIITRLTKKGSPRYEVRSIKNATDIIEYNQFSDSIVIDWERFHAHDITANGKPFCASAQSSVDAALASLSQQHCPVPLLDVRKKPVYKMWSGSLEYQTSQKVEAIRESMSLARRDQYIIGLMRAPSTSAYNIYNEIFMHGTDSHNLNDLLRLPPMNRGFNDYSGPGICGALGEDTSLALRYAEDAARKSLGKADPVIVYGHFNKRKPLNVGVIRIKNSNWIKADFMKGLFSPKWSTENPVLARAIQKKFGALYVIDAAKGKSNTVCKSGLSNKFIVATPRADKSALVWDRYATIKNGKWTFRSIIFGKRVPFDLERIKSIRDVNHSKNRFLGKFVLPLVVSLEFFNEVSRAHSLGCHNVITPGAMTTVKMTVYHLLYSAPNLLVRGASLPVMIIGVVSEIAYALEQNIAPVYERHCAAIDEMIAQGASSEELRSYMREGGWATIEMMGKLKSISWPAKYFFSPITQKMTQAFDGMGNVLYTASADYETQILKDFSLSDELVKWFSRKRKIRSGHPTIESGPRRSLPVSQDPTPVLSAAQGNTVGWMSTIEALANLGVSIISNTGHATEFYVQPDSEFMQQPQMQAFNSVLRTAEIYAQHAPFDPFEIDVKNYAGFAAPMSIPEVFARGGFVPPKPGEWDVSDSLPGVDKITLSADGNNIILGAVMGAGMVSFKLSPLGGYIVSTTVPFGPKFFSTLASTSFVAAGVFGVAWGVTFGIQKYQQHICRKLNRDLINAQQDIEVIQKIMSSLSDQLGGAVQVNQLGDLLRNVREAKSSIGLELSKSKERQAKARSRWLGAGKEAAKSHAQITAGLTEQNRQLGKIESSLSFEQTKSSFKLSHQNDSVEKLLKEAKQFDGKILSTDQKAQAAGLSDLAERQVLLRLINGDVTGACSLIDSFNKVKASKEIGSLPEFSYHPRKQLTDERARSVREENGSRVDTLNKLIGLVNSDIEKGMVPTKNLKALESHLKESNVLWKKKQKDDSIERNQYIEPDKMQITKIMKSGIDYDKEYLQPLKNALSNESSPIDVKNISIACEFVAKHDQQPIEFFIENARDMVKGANGEYSIPDSYIREALLTRLSRTILRSDQPITQQIQQIEDVKKAVPEKADHADDLMLGVVRAEQCKWQAQQSDTASSQLRLTQPTPEELSSLADTFLTQSAGCYAKPKDERTAGDQVFLSRARQYFMHNIYQLCAMGKNKIACAKIDAQSLQDKGHEAHYIKLKGIIAHSSNDSWGGPSWLRFLGGLSAYAGLGDEIPESEYQIPEELVNVPRGYAHEDEQLGVRQAAKDRVAATKQAIEAGHDAGDEKIFDCDQGHIVAAESNLRKRLGHLAKKGYYQDAIDLLHKMHPEGLSEEDQHYVRALTFSQQTQVIGQISSMFTRLMRSELSGSDIGPGKKRALFFLLNVLGTTERVLPNALAMSLQSAHEAWQANPQLYTARSGSRDAMRELYANLTNPRSMAGATMLAQVVVEAVGWLPMERGLSLIGVNQARRHDIQAAQAHIVNYGNTLLSVGSSFNAVRQLLTHGLNSALAVSSACGLINTAFNFRSRLGEGTIEPWGILPQQCKDFLVKNKLKSWGLLPEQINYYSYNSQRELWFTNIGVCSSIVEGLGLLRWGPKKVSSYAVAMAAMAAVAFSIWQSYGSSTQKSASLLAINAALQNIHNMEQLRWKLIYFETTPCVLMSIAPSAHTRSKIEKGQVIVVIQAEDGYEICMQGDSGQVKQALLALDKATIESIFSDGEPRVATKEGGVLLRSHLKQYAIKHPIFKEYLLKAKVVLCAAPLNESIKEEIKAGHIIVFERFGRSNDCYQLHFKLTKDDSADDIIPVKLNSDELLKNLPWPDDSVCTLRKQNIDLLTLAANTIVLHYTKQSRDRVGEFLRNQFGGDERYNDNQDRVINEARKLLFQHKLQEQMIKGMYDDKPEMPKPKEMVDGVSHQRPASRELPGWMLEALKLTEIVDYSSGSAVTVDCHSGSADDPKQVYLGGRVYKIPLRYAMGLLRTRLILMAKKAIFESFRFESEPLLGESPFKLVFKQCWQNVYNHLAGSYQQEWNAFNEMFKDVLAIYFQELIQLANLSYSAYGKFKNDEDYSSHVKACRIHVIKCLKEIKLDYEVVTWKSALPVESAFYAAAFLYTFNEESDANTFLEHTMSDLKEFLSDKDADSYNSYVSLMLAHFEEKQVFDVIFSSSSNRMMQLIALRLAVADGKWSYVDAIAKEMKLDELPPYARAKRVFDHDPSNYLEALEILQDERERDIGCYWSLLLTVLTSLFHSIERVYPEKYSTVRHLFAAAWKFSFDQWLRFSGASGEDVEKMKEQVNHYFKSSMNAYFEKETPGLSESSLSSKRTQFLNVLGDTDASNAENKLLKDLFSSVQSHAMKCNDELMYMPYITPEAVGSFYGILGTNKEEGIKMLKAAIQSSGEQGVRILGSMALDVKNELSGCGDVSVCNKSDLEIVMPYLEKWLKFYHPSMTIVRALACLKGYNLRIMNWDVEKKSLSVVDDYSFNSNYESLIVWWQDAGPIYHYHKLMPLSLPVVQEVSDERAADIQRCQQPRTGSVPGMFSLPAPALEVGESAPQLNGRA